MNIKKTAKNEYVFSVITKLISFTISIVQSVLVARFLGAGLKGVNAYISSITSVSSIIITFGMHQAYPFFRKKYGKEAIYQDYVSLIMLLFGFYMAVGLVMAAVIPASLQVKAVFVLTPMLGYSHVVAYVTLVEEPNLRNKWWTIIAVADIIYVVILWLFVERSMEWGISILFFADLLKCVVYTRLLKVKPRYHKGQKKMLIELAKFGFFPMIALLMTSLNYRIDVIMLHAYPQITDAMIGVYSLGITLSEKIIIITDTLKGVMISKLSKGADSREVAKVARLCFWSSLLVTLAIVVLGKPVIDLLYGAEFSGAYQVVLVTAIGVIALNYSKLIAAYNVVNRHQIRNVILLSIAIIVDVVFNLLLIPKWGILGAAVATTLGNLVCGIVFVIYFLRETGIRFTEMIALQKRDLQLLKGISAKKGARKAVKPTTENNEPEISMAEAEVAASAANEEEAEL